jgi:hydrogenase maturation protein HypF
MTCGERMNVAADRPRVDVRISIAARAIQVHGVVQGVGFRPFVWRLATDLGLRGWVRNRGGVVEIRGEGDVGTLDRFRADLASQAPPLARVEDVRWVPAAPSGLAGFHVDDSEPVAEGARLVPPDVATFAACLDEVFDPGDRRYRYPFTNCTDCGPRFTIIEDLPYDCARTSMRAFPMCEDCAREYHDPSDRRFHAEPVACPSCGPRLELRDAVWKRVRDDAIERAADLLRAGRIVAIKGLGGFHLACDAMNDGAVALLRDRKHRPAKPFAVMVADLDIARDLFDIDADEAALLSSGEAPIVLVADRGRLSPAVAPGHRRQGAMLPSTPLHHLLLREAGLPLVMTSGNRSGEPICISNDDARERLTAIADAFLVHDREIVARYDDSVSRVSEGVPVTIRRARGQAPSAISLSAPVPPILGRGRCSTARSAWHPGPPLTCRSTSATWSPRRPWSRSPRR